MYLLWNRYSETPVTLLSTSIVSKQQRDGGKRRVSMGVVPSILFSQQQDHLSYLCNPGRRKQLYPPGQGPSLPRQLFYKTEGGERGREGEKRDKERETERETERERERERERGFGSLHEELMPSKQMGSVLYNMNVNACLIHFTSGKIK